MEPTLLRRPMLPTRPKRGPHLAVNSLSNLSSINTACYASPSPQSSRYAAHCPPPQPPTEITPRLYISDISAAENLSTLSALGITHVVSAMPGHVAIPQSSSHQIRCLQIPLQDNPFAELAEHLPRTSSFIREALRDPRSRVLVHCVQGISRSSAVVGAYLIAEYGWSPQKAIAHVKSKRSHADPNPGFITQLGEYADSLRIRASSRSSERRR